MLSSALVLLKQNQSGAEHAKTVKPSLSKKQVLVSVAISKALLIATLT
jgi:hypothetical protein